MLKGKNASLYVLGVLSLTTVVGLFTMTRAEVFTSPNYTINGITGGSFGGSGSSTNYGLFSTGGESIVGPDGSSSYQLASGYQGQLSCEEEDPGINGLVAHYEFEEGSGTTSVDSSTNSNDASLLNGTAWTTGNVGSYGLGLDGVDDYALVADNASLNSSQITAALWVKLDTSLSTQPHSYPALVSKRGSNQGFAMYLFGSQQELQISIGDGTTQSIYDTAVSSFDWTQWHHVAFTYDGQALTTYVDGQQVGQTTIAHGMTPYAGDMMIGDITDYTGSTPDGTLDDLKLFDRALTAAEVQEVYDGGSASVIDPCAYIELSTQPDGLNAYYSFDAGAGNIAFDSAVNNIDGNMISAPNWTTGQVGSGIDLEKDSSQYVNLGDADSLVSDSATYSMWLKPETTTGARGILSKNENPYDTGLLLLQDNEAFEVYAKSSTMTVGKTSFFTAGSWVHVAVTVDAGTVRIFKNGQPVASGNYTGGIGTNDFDMLIGQQNGFSRHFDGVIDEVKIFGRVLSDDEIEADYQAGVAGISSGVSLGTVIPGVSEMVNFDTIIDTNWANYSLAINQSQFLTSGASTIPNVSGSIASPVAWSEGSTKGLGFSIVSAAGLDGKWGSGANFAAFPDAAVTFYNRNGFAGGKEVIDMRLRLDTAVTQSVGDYNNQVIITGTLTP